MRERERVGHSASAGNRRTSCTKKYEVFSAEVHTGKGRTQENIFGLFSVFLLLLMLSHGDFSPLLRFHGSAKRAIASASVWRREVKGWGWEGCVGAARCGQTPGCTYGLRVAGWRGRWTQCRQMCCRSPPHTPTPRPSP